MRNIPTRAIFAGCAHAAPHIANTIMKLTTHALLNLILSDQEIRNRPKRGVFMHISPVQNRKSKIVSSKPLPLTLTESPDPPATSTFGGIVNPICLAVFKLTMNSNFIGCSTGRSAGLAALRILSTIGSSPAHKS